MLSSSTCMSSVRFHKSTGRKNCQESKFIILLQVKGACKVISFNFTKCELQRQVGHIKKKINRVKMLQTCLNSQMKSNLSLVSDRRTLIVFFWTLSSSVAGWAGSLHGSSNSTTFSLILAHFPPALRNNKRQNEMYIFLNPSVAIERQKMGSWIAPINDVNRAVWERKHLHGNVQRKPNKQTNSDRLLQSCRVGSFCDTVLPTWESFLWDQSGTSPMASSVLAGGRVCKNAAKL